MLLIGDRKNSTVDTSPRRESHSVISPLIVLTAKNHAFFRVEVWLKFHGCRSSPANFPKVKRVMMRCTWQICVTQTKLICQIHRQQPRLLLVLTFIASPSRGKYVGDHDHRKQPANSKRVCATQEAGGYKYCGETRKTETERWNGYI